jgi:cold shock CspA family protein
MVKIMLFIDGTWLYSNLPRLREIYGQDDFQIDFGKLPQVLAQEVAKDAGMAAVDVVRTYLFGSYASNHDPRDEEAIQRRREFFSMLREEFRYEVEAFPINFMGRRLRKADRDLGDTFEPKEKCVDISLAATMLYYAALPYAYDIALVVAGDQDFKPVLQYVRRLGKRVALASIKGSCAPELADPADAARVRDFDVIWIDKILQKLELTYEKHLRACESPFHKGKRDVWTTFHPRKGQRFFCKTCRDEFNRQKQEAHREFPDHAPFENEGEEEHVEAGSVGLLLPGMVTKKVIDRGFGFIHAADGKDYFFHLSDLTPGLDFDDVVEGLDVEFEIRKTPIGDRAGAAQNVRRRQAPAMPPAEEATGTD